MTRPVGDPDRGLKPLSHPENHPRHRRLRTHAKAREGLRPGGSGGPAQRGAQPPLGGPAPRGAKPRRCLRLRLADFHDATAGQSPAPSAGRYKHAEPLGHPLFGLRGPVLVEAVRRLPQVLQHMDDVENDGELGAHLGRRPAYARDLVLVSVDENHPTPLVVGVATQGLPEGLVDDLLHLLLQARPYPLVRRPRARLLRRRIAHGTQIVHDVVRLSWERRDVVHGRDLGHALAVLFLPFRQPLVRPTRVALLLLGRLARGGTQVPLAHHHAGTIEGEYEQQSHCGLRRLDVVHQRARIELVEIDRGPHRQLFHLALLHRRSGRLADGGHHFVERPARRFLGHAPTHPERVELRREIQRCVQRKERAGAVRLIRPPLRFYRSHERQEPPAQPPPRRALGPIGPRHRLDPRLRGGAKIQVPLQHSPLNLTAIPHEILLQLLVRHGQRFGRLEMHDHLVERLPGLRKSCDGDGLLVRCAHRGLGSRMVIGISYVARASLLCHPYV